MLKRYYIEDSNLSFNHRYMLVEVQDFILAMFLVRLTQYMVFSVCPPVCLSFCLFQLASGEVSLTILLSNIVGEYRRVFFNYPEPKN